MKYSFLKSISLFALTVIISFNGATLKAGDKISFTNESIEIALERASAEGKLVFMDFYANWCTPCKWMEETTFRDNRVIDALNEDYISLKINIDDMEGFRMKSNYDVNFLPTMLILNSSGKMVERIEETMVADELLGILDMHNSPENKTIIVHDYNRSPKNINSDSSGEEDNPWSISPDDYRRYKEMVNKRNYRVQIGAYSDYANAQKQVNYLRETFAEPIVVLNDFKDDKVIFKVMLGQFKTMSEANSFCKILSTNFGIKAVVN